MIVVEPHKEIKIIVGQKETTLFGPTVVSINRD